MINLESFRSEESSLSEYNRGRLKELARSEHASRECPRYRSAHGKGYVEFMTSRNADLARDVLLGEERAGSYGNVQKRVSLKSGEYFRVRNVKEGK